MKKVIEKATLKIIQEMEKNRKTCNEARDWLNDTGCYKYQKKIDKLDAEYEELKSFLHTDKTEEVQSEEIEKYNELRKTLLNIKSKWVYLKADMPVSIYTIDIDDLLRDIR